MINNYHTVYAIIWMYHFYITCSRVVLIGYIRWEHRRLLELVYKPFVYVIIYTIKYFMIASSLAKCPVCYISFFKIKYTINMTIYFMRYEIWEENEIYQIGHQCPFCLLSSTPWLIRVMVRESKFEARLAKMYTKTDATNLWTELYAKLTSIIKFQCVGIMIGKSESWK